VQSAQVCTGLHRFAQVCAGLHRFAQVCTGLHRFAQVCTGLHRYFLILGIKLPLEKTRAFYDGSFCNVTLKIFSISAYFS
jgi:hypothetical protein